MFIFPPGPGRAFAAALIALSLAACNPTPQASPEHFGSTALEAPWQRALYARMANGLLGTRGDLLRAEARYAALLAQPDAATADRDVLFAAVILEHSRFAPAASNRNSRLAEEVLLPLGFPSEKLPAVRALLVELKRDAAPVSADAIANPGGEAVGG